AFGKMRGFPISDQQIKNAESCDRAAKPRRSNNLTQTRPANHIGDKNEQIIFAPVAEHRVPGRKDQIKAKQQAQHYEENYSESFDHKCGAIFPAFPFRKDSLTEKVYNSIDINGNFAGC